MPVEYSRPIKDLMDLSGEAFVAECYWLILRRAPDPSGLAHNLHRLLARKDKLALAADLASSDEARALPASSKRFIQEILTLHAGALISAAWTPKQRRSAANRIARYFSALSGLPTATGGTQEIGNGDPFATYLRGVIEDRNAK